ncbi:MAG: exodeoxyribonuclease VII large subunit [Saprospiraceae bacterium]
MQPTTYSLSDLTTQLRRVVALNFAQSLWIKCELAQVNLSRGQHYLNLIQKEAETGEIIAAADAILWFKTHNRLKRKLGRSLDAILQSGMEVLLQVKIEYHERWGLSLHIEDVDPSYTLGQLELQRQETIAKLEKANLLAKNREIPLPLVAQRVAIISSINAAGYQDFLRQLEQNDYQYQFDCQLFSAAMQGAQVEQEVLQQLKRIRRARKPFDVVVIIRGGGAKLDLAVFDSLKIAQAVAKFPLPVLTGIGHDTDEVILDLVAHTALKTPTAVAEFLIQYHLRFETRLLNLGMQAQRAAQTQLAEQQYNLQRLRENLRFHSQLPLQRAQQQLQQIATQLPQVVDFQVKRAQQQLNSLSQIVALLDPVATLGRGFALIKKDGKYLTQIGQVAANDVVEIVMQDGQIEVERR